jgi:pimeloyl-ACP methyl ester carboxylesterase
MLLFFIILLLSSALPIRAQGAGYTITLNKGDDRTINVALSSIPVILVHGWYSSPEVWGPLISKLDAQGITHHEFSYSPATGDPREYARQLEGFINSKLGGYQGKFDIVCHSMGALVSRWYMEELGGASRVRQWIGIAPVSHGSASADLEAFFLKEKAVQQMQTFSETVSTLDRDGFPPGIQNRVIEGINGKHNPIFGIPGIGITLHGRTITRKAAFPYYFLTYLGDGLVSVQQGLTGGGNECYNLDHNALPRNGTVCDEVVKYLLNPGTASPNNCPTDDPADIPAVLGLAPFGALALPLAANTVQVVVDPTVRKFMLSLNWGGSDLGLTLTSPSGAVMKPGKAPVSEYKKTGTDTWYAIDSPEQGTWTARVDSVDVPKDGELFSFYTFFDSSIALFSGTSDGRTTYATGEVAPITATLQNNGVPITGASVSAAVTRPDNSTESLPLHDDGVRSDAQANDGVYTYAYQLSMTGGYGITMTGSGPGGFQRAGVLALSAAFKPTSRTWGHDSIGITTPSQTWYLAEGCTAGGFETWVLVQNPNDSPANIQLTYMTPEGSIPGPRVNLSPNSRRTFYVADTVPNAWEVSSKVSANKPVIAERAVYGPGRAWGTDSIGASETSKTWYLAEGCTNGGFETWILVQNPNGKPADVSLTYMTSDGQKPGPSVTLPPNSRKTFNVGETLPGNWDVSTFVSAKEPVVAERAVYWNGRKGAHDSIGVTAPDDTWYLAEGCTNGGFETWVLVQNPYDSPASVDLTFMTETGERPGPHLDLAPHSRQSVDVSKTVPDTWSVSTKVTSKQPVIAERAVYWNGRIEGHDSIGTTTPAKTWYLAEGCTGAGFETWVLVQNPNNIEANVSLTYMTPSGPVNGPSETIAANSRKTFNIAETVPGVYEVSAKVTSNVPVIAERAMYGDVK